MTECCENCKYYTPLKIAKRVVDTIGEHGIVSGWKVSKNSGRFDETHCCVALLDEADGFVLEVEPNDMCEMFEGKEQKDECK